MDKPALKTVFFGTPEVAVPFLRLLARRSKLQAVVSQPDKPAGRGLRVSATPVKAVALEMGLPVLQPAHASEIAAQLPALGADLAVVVAYGRLLKADALDCARLGFMNVHFSLLPKYRGAAPVQWALARGETRTGVTLFWLDEGMDTGPIQAVAETEIAPDEDAPALLRRLVELGVELLERALCDLEAGRVQRRPQSGSPSLAPRLKREDARLDLSCAAEQLAQRVRAFRDWPRAWLRLDSGRLLVLRAVAAGSPDPPGTGRAGRVLAVDRTRGLLVECGSCSRLWFLEVQPEGKKTLSAADFANGLRLAAGDFLPWTGSENDDTRPGDRTA